MKALGTEHALLTASPGNTLASALATLAVRFGLGALGVSLICRLSPVSCNRYELIHGSILGLITALSMFLQVDSLNYTSASTSGFLIALYCVLVPLFSFALGWRRLTPILAVSCALVVLGLGVLTRVDPRDFRLGRGEWENLGAATLFAVQILWLGRLRAEAFSPERMTMALCGSVALACLLALACMEGGPATLMNIHASGRAMTLTVFLALAGTALPFLIMNRYQPKVDPVLAGFIYCCEPIATALGALALPALLVRFPALYPNEPLTTRVWIGGGCILLANLILLRDRPDATDASDP